MKGDLKMKKVTVDDEFKKKINDYLYPFEGKIIGKKYDYSYYLDFFKGIEFDDYISIKELIWSSDDFFKLRDYKRDDKKTSYAGFGYKLIKPFLEFDKGKLSYVLLAMNDKDKIAQLCCSAMSNIEISQDFVGYFTLAQSTDRGLYRIVLWPYMHECILDFFDNNTLKEHAEKSNSFDSAKYILSVDYNIASPKHEIFPFKYDIQKEDFARLCNKIFREGISYAVDIVRSGGVFELTDEDKKFYEEKEINESIQESSLNDSNVESYGISAANSIPSVEKRNDVAERLQALKDAGIKLSSEQESLIILNNKINSQEFKDYKANSEARKEGQEEETAKRVEISKKREEWQNSPEHPTNKRIEELEKIKKQVKALEQFRNIDESLLTPEQKEMLNNGSIFLEMYGKAESEEHYVDTGMSQEIRDWYKDVYGEQETSHKSR